MHVTRLVTVAALAALTTVVPATAAAAAPAPAAASPKLVYTTLSQSADGLDRRTVDTVRYDATGRTLIGSSTSDFGTDGPDSEIVGPAATASPDHTRVAWTREDFTATPAGYAVEVSTLATKAVAVFPLPAGATFASGRSYLAWSADGTWLALTLTRGSTSTLTKLDVATGTFTPLFALARGLAVQSIAVSADGSVAFTTDTGVAVLVGGTTPVRFLHHTGTDEYCTSVRARPASQREFTYLCSTYSATAGSQVIRSQTPTGTARTVYSADISSSSTAPITYLDGFAWAPSGASMALVTTTVRSVDTSTCTNAMTTTLSTVKAAGTGRTTLQTEPTITAQTCRGNGWGDVDTVVWAPDGQTVVFLHATKFLGPQSAFAVRPATPQTQTVLAKAVIDLAS